MIANTADGATQPDLSAGTAATRVRHWRRWMTVVTIGLTVVVVAGLVVAWNLGSSYQPLSFGGSSGGIPGQIIAREVNDFAQPLGQVYIPPQKADHGALLESLTNTGSYPVTIESATLNNPDYEAQAPQNLALRDTGPATYWPITGVRTGTGRPLAGLELRPGQDVWVRLPITTAGCWMRPSGYGDIDSFWVRFKFLFWTHLVEVQWTSPFDQSEGAIVTQSPRPAAQGGFCPR